MKGEILWSVKTLNKWRSLQSMVEAFCVMFLSWRYGRHLSWSHVSPLQHFSRPSLYLLSIIFATTVFNSQCLPYVCVCVNCYDLSLNIFLLLYFKTYKRLSHTSSDNLQDVIIIKCYFHAYLPQHSNQRHGINFLIDLLFFFNFFFFFV